MSFFLLAIIRQNIFFSILVQEPHMCGNSSKYLNPKTQFRLDFARIQLGLGLYIIAGVFFLLACLNKFQHNCQLTLFFVKFCEFDQTNVQALMIDDRDDNGLGKMLFVFEIHIHIIVTSACVWYW